MYYLSDFDPEREDFTNYVHVEGAPSDAAGCSVPSPGDRVRINRPGLGEHGRSGIARHCDEELGWVSVDLDDGPPWRGRYTLSELDYPIL